MDEQRVPAESQPIIESVRLEVGPAAEALVAQAKELPEPEGQAWQMLAEERDRLREILRVLPDGVIIADARGMTYGLMNETAVRMLGIDLAGQPLLHPDGPSAVRPDGGVVLNSELPLQRAALKGETVSGEQLKVRAAGGGRELWVRVNAAPLRGPRGDITGAVASFQDITEVKEFERQKDLFLAAASHDLKNPLSVIRLAVSLIEREIGQKHEVSERLTRLVQEMDLSIGRAMQQVDDLMDVAQLQMGQRLHLRRSKVELVGLLRGVARTAAAAYRFDIAVRSAAPVLDGEWDRERLNRVFSNLLENACTHAGPRPRIEVTVREEAGEAVRLAVVEVRDHGWGIPAEALPRVFDPFYRGSNANGGRGLGIGLAAVRDIIREHEGTIEVESQEGHGTTFTVRLPLPGRTTP